MKKRYLYLDEKKFSHLLERMEGKMTLNESQNKRILSESWIDEVIVAAKRSAANAFEFIGKNIPIKVIDNTKKHWDEIVERAINLSAQIDEALKTNNFNRMVKNLGSDFITNFKISLKNMNESIVKSFVDALELTAEIQDDILKWINGVNETLSLDTLSILKKFKERGIDIEPILDAQRKATLKANKDFDVLDRIFRYFESYEGENIPIKDFFSDLFIENKALSIEDFKSDWKKFDDLAEESPEIKKIWEPFKERIEGKPTDYIHAGDLLKSDLINDPRWVTIQEKLKTKITQFIGKKIFGKIYDIKLELNKGGIDWNNTLVYLDGEGNVIVMTTKNQDELAALQKQLNEKGFTTYVGEGGYDKATQKALTQEDIVEANIKTKKRVIWFWFKLGGLAVLTLGVLYTTYCYVNSKEFTEAELAIINAEREMDGKEPLDGKSWWDMYTLCTAESAKEISIEIKDIVVDVWDRAVNPYLILIDDAIEKYLNKLCQRPSNEKNDDGSWKEECKRCIDCNKDEIVVNNIKVGNKNLTTFYKETLEDLDLRSLLSYAGVPQERIDAAIEDIHKDAEGGKISKWITKDGKTISLAEMIKLICSKHSIECLSRLVEKTLTEFFTYDGIPCDKLENHFTDKINVLKKLNNENLLGWTESGKVDLSTLKSGYEKLIIAQNVDGVLNVLEDYKNQHVEMCKNDGGSQKQSYNYVVELGNMMNWLWDEELLQLDCTNDSYRHGLTLDGKAFMKTALDDIVRKIVSELENNFYIELAEGMKTNSSAYTAEFEKWWVKQRLKCNITD